MTKTIHFLLLIPIYVFLCSCSHSTPDNVKILRYENGNIKSVEIYNAKADSLIFVRSFSKDNVVDSEITYRNGHKNGLSLFYKNGILDKECHYKMDTLDGTFTEYFFNSKPSIVKVYDKGRFMANTVYDTSGTLLGANPFVYIFAKRDTINFGEVYTATVSYNCPSFEGNELLVGLYRKDKNGKFTKIVDGADVNECMDKAKIEITPEKKGEYYYKGIVSYAKYANVNKKDTSLEGNAVNFEGSFYVK
jgi:hypothetical protein